MINEIHIPSFIEWALKQRGYALCEGKLQFYRFYFAKLDKNVQNSQIKKFLNQ